MTGNGPRGADALKKSSSSILTVRYSLASSVREQHTTRHRKEKNKQKIETMFFCGRQEESSIKHRKMHARQDAAALLTLCAVLSLRSLITSPNSQSQIVSKNLRLFLRDSL